MANLISMLRGKIQEGVTSVAYSPDGAFIVTGGSPPGPIPDQRDSGASKLWDASTGNELYELYGYWSKREHVHHGPVQAVCFSPDSRWILTAGSAGVVVWPVSEHQQPHLVLNLNPVRSVHSANFSPDGSHIVVGYADGIVVVWNSQNGKKVWSRYVHAADLSHSAFVTVDSVVYSHDGKRILSGGSEGTLKMCDAFSGAEILVLNPRRGYISSVACSPDGNNLVGGCFEGVAMVWDMRNGEPVRILETTIPVLAVAFSPNGDRVATGLTKGLIVWDFNTGKKIDELPVGGVSSMAFSPDGKRLAIASGGLSIWDMSS